MDSTPKLDPFQLYTSLAATLGEQEAAAVVSSITRNNDLVTRAHFDARVAEFDTRFAEFGARFAEMNAKIDTGFAEFDARLAEIDTRFAEMNAKIDTGLAQVGVEFAQANARHERSLRNLTVWMVATIIAANSALAGILTTIH